MAGLVMIQKSPTEKQREIETLETLKKIETSLKSLDCNIELLTLTLVNHINSGGDWE
ncbi:MAG: hypothetical protein GQF41_1059 [Candidatus Rifleibacterium amylolyticum]|nr:MAG: hypothetical protein GQF41_1059 [Candidatus Rifleibacterium amylolyticum]